MPPSATAACMPPAPITYSRVLFFAISAEHLYGELQRQEILLFGHPRSLEQVHGEENYTKSGQIGNFNTISGDHSNQDPRYRQNLYITLFLLSILGPDYYVLPL